MMIDFEPEDWAGLEKRLQTIDVEAKDELLAVVRADEPKDLDKKEWKLRQVAGGAPYRYILQTVYPALRHSDYVVQYKIRNFTADEAKELLYSDPKQLSLNEMFQVAQTYEPGSDAFCEVFEIAVRMFPDDPVSNLNAATRRCNWAVSTRHVVTWPKPRILPRNVWPRLSPCFWKETSMMPKPFSVRSKTNLRSRNRQFITNNK